MYPLEQCLCPSSFLSNWAELKLTSGLFDFKHFDRQPRGVFNSTH